MQTRSGVRGNLLTPDPMPPFKPTTKKPDYFPQPNCKMSTETPAALVGDNGGDPQGTLPALQDWAAARTLALTQPTQPKNGASVQTTLRDSPETPLGFSVMAITLPTAVTPMGALPASTTFLLPYTEGQVEALLTVPLAAAAKAKRKGFRLTTGTSRDHEQVSPLYGELMSESCPVTQVI